jgi:hypothetical protein
MFFMQSYNNILIKYEYFSLCGNFPIEHETFFCAKQTLSNGSREPGLCYLNKKIIWNHL